MARPLRISYPGALYHLTSRGNEQRPIFWEDSDRHHFLRILAHTVERFSWLCYAYCLMDNHFHLFVETLQANVSQGMHYLNGVFTQYFNWKHKRVGHLFQGRFKGILVEKESYFLELSRYIPLNPVRAGICNDPGDYVWSSYRATAGLCPIPLFLNVKPILERFGTNEIDAQQAYQIFLKEKMVRCPWQNLKGNLILGSDKFIQTLPDHIRRLDGIVLAQTNLQRPPLGSILALPDGLIQAVQTYKYQLQEIAEHLGIHRNTAATRYRQQCTAGVRA